MSTLAVNAVNPQSGTTISSSAATLSFDASAAIDTSGNTLTLSDALTVSGAATLSSTLSAGATTVTSLLASSDDVGAIGASGTAFSDLFLASGAVIDFNAGDVVITHSANDLAITGGNLTISENDVVLTLNDTSATGSPALDFQQAGTQRGFIQYQDTGDYLEFQAVGGFKFNDYGGSSPLVGIGINPTVPLHVQVDYGSSRIVTFDNSTATNPSGMALILSGASPDNNTQTFLTCDDSTTSRCIIYSDGDLANHDGTYGTISDVALKQEITDARSYWDDFKNLQYRKYKMNDDVEAYGDNAEYRVGLVAQEVEVVFPSLVKVGQDDMKFVKSSIIDGVINSIVLQEAMARIEALEAQIGA